MRGNYRQQHGDAECNAQFLLDSECDRNLALQEANRNTSPWSLTQGIDYNLLVQQRELATDYSLCYCKTPGANFTSTDCSCSGVTPGMSSTNGGVCQTVSPQPNTPMSTNCVALSIGGKINVINGTRGPLNPILVWRGIGNRISADVRGQCGHNSNLPRQRWGRPSDPVCNIRCGPSNRYSRRLPSRTK